MCEYYGEEDKYEDICDWYDGYRFGDKDVFNPWSVINYFYNNCKNNAYWQSTGDNSIIHQIVSQADSDTIDNLSKLMQGQTISSYVDTAVIYPEIKKDSTTIYSFLLSAGYLKIVNKDILNDGNSICDLAIPNKEIFSVYEKEILSALSNRISSTVSLTIQKAIMNQDIETLQSSLHELLFNAVSYFDYSNENFYHGFLLGLCAIMNEHYKVESNRESGYGRYDIQLTPYDKNMLGVIIEIKVSKESDYSEKKLESLADIALKQIDEKQYKQQMQLEGVNKFLKIGVAFYKKQVKIISEIE